MAHTSPAVNLVWALLSTMLMSFLIFHLWSFDRFKCLKWNHGPYSGAFKRVMTYSYLMSVPLMIIYSVGFAVIKYTYGFTSFAFVGIMVTPYDLWSKSAQNAVIPLYLSISMAWALEMVTHLEGRYGHGHMCPIIATDLSIINYFTELCFWLFLVNSNATQQDWFRSSYFKIWAVGSCAAVLVMPLITILTRENVYKCEAYTFLAGGLGSFAVTIWFLPVLRVFPSFIANLKQHGVEPSTLIRLAKFHELNCIRVVFRFLFTVPVVILGADGVRPHQHVNDNMLATDLLSMVAGFGCVISSGLTLVIFFPRSFEGEMAIKEQQRSRRKQRTQQTQDEWSRSQVTQGDALSYMSITHKSEMDLADRDLDRVRGRDPERNDSKDRCYKSESGLPTYDAIMVTHGQDRYVSPPSKVLSEETAGGASGSMAMSMSLQPNRRKETGDVELGGVLSESEVNLARARSQRDRTVNELVYYWRSPLDVGQPAR